MRLAAFVALASLAPGAYASSAPLPDIRTGQWEITTTVWQGPSPTPVAHEGSQPQVETGVRCLDANWLRRVLVDEMVAAKPNCSNTVHEKSGRRVTASRRCLDEDGGEGDEIRFDTDARFDGERYRVQMTQTALSEGSPVEEVRVSSEARYLGACPDE